MGGSDGRIVLHLHWTIAVWNVLAALTCSWILERRKAEPAAETRLAQNDWGKSGHVAPAQVFSGSEPLPVNLANFRSFF